MNVSVTLRLRDQFTGPVRQLMQQLQGLTRAAQEFNRALGGSGAPAEVDATMSLAPGERIQFDERCGVPGETINVTAADTGHAFVLLVGQRAGIE